MARRSPHMSLVLFEVSACLGGVRLWVLVMSLETVELN